MSLSLSDPSLLKNQAYVDGQWIDADSGETFAVTNPANGEVITEVAKLGNVLKQYNFHRINPFESFVISFEDQWHCPSTRER